MASRRQKFKPLAGIQKARRTQSTVSEAITNNVIKSEPPLDITSLKIEDNKKDENEVTADHSINVSSSDPNNEEVPSQPYENTDQPEGNPSVNVAPRPIRRSIKPAVVIPDRRRKLIPAAVEVKQEENSERVLPLAEIAEKSQKSLTPVTPLTPLKLKQENSNNIQKPITSDDTFKPPFLSPSTQQKRPEFVYNPLEQQNSDGIDDPTKSPVYSSKIRQRIKPTPYFCRRNSVQGAASESEDETNKRQRHLSTSSNHSSYNVNNNQTPKATSGENTRTRTESVCSNVSEATFQIFSKPKRIARSEEFQRIANAKKEFHQRFNGKTPDKQHLTMYDMIYYNPITNPLKNPAVKSSDVKERRSSTASSVHSVASMRSIKTEVKTSEDSSETEMPVPQLKLGPNGEIVLDEKSLVIETTGDKEARETLANSDIVYDDEFSGSTGFYKRQKRTREWDANETIKFYRCLHSVGTDFSLMLMLFPNRSRRDLKLKFKKEEKTNLNLINKALLHPKEFNIDELKVDLEREERELEQKKLEWEELKQKHAKERREQSRLLKQKNRKSIAARNIAGSETIYDHEFAVAPRKNRKLGAYVTKPDTSNSDSLPTFDDTFPKPSLEQKPTIAVIKNEYLMPNVEKTKPSMCPLAPQDILNMDIVFDGTDNADSCVEPPLEAVPMGIISTENTVVTSENNFIFVDCPCPAESIDPKTKVKVEDDDEEYTDVDNEEDLVEAEQEGYDSNNESHDSLSMKELAVVASHSVDDPNNVIYEVYAVSATTGALSDKPLDLPPDVVEQIRMSIGV